MLFLPGEPKNFGNFNVSSGLLVIVAGQVTPTEECLMTIGRRKLTFGFITIATVLLLSSAAFACTV